MHMAKLKPNKPGKSSNHAWLVTDLLLDIADNLTVLGVWF